MWLSTIFSGVALHAVAMSLLSNLQGSAFVASAQTAKDPLDYRDVTSSYVAPKPQGVKSLLDFIESRPDLSNLREALAQSGGFELAFDTNPTWNFTFFAPNNHAFREGIGRYFSTFRETAAPADNIGSSRKGKWWLGNTIIHHYVPNTILESSVFNETYQRFQTATYLYVGSQVKDGQIELNKVSTIVEKDIPVPRGVVHVIDRILDPSAQIYESDLPWLEQKFIPGSCSNPDLPYC